MRRVQLQKCCTAFAFGSVASDSSALLNRGSNVTASTQTHPKRFVSSTPLRLRGSEEESYRAHGSSSTKPQSFASSSNHREGGGSPKNPYVSPTNYRPLYGPEDIIELLKGVGLWEAVSPVVFARAGCADETELFKILQEKASRTSNKKKTTSDRDDSEAAAAASESNYYDFRYELFPFFDQFGTLFSHYFTFEDRQLVTAGEVLLQKYMSEAIGSYASYYNIVLSPASVKQLSAAAVNYHSLRLWAEDGCALQRFLSAPPMIEMPKSGCSADRGKADNTANHPSSERKETTTKSSSSSSSSPPPEEVKSHGRLSRHAHMRELLSLLKNGGVQEGEGQEPLKHDTPLPLLPPLTRLLFSPPLSQPSRTKDLGGTTFFHYSARFAKGDLSVKLCHLIGLVEAEFGPDCAMWFVNNRYRLRDVGEGGVVAEESGATDGSTEDGNSKDDPPSELGELLKGVGYEVIELPARGKPVSANAVSSSAEDLRAPLLSSTFVNNDITRGGGGLKGELKEGDQNASPKGNSLTPRLGLRIVVDFSGSVPNFVSLVAKHLSACLEQYPSSAVAESVLLSQGLGVEYVGRSVLVPLPKPTATTGESSDSAEGMGSAEEPSAEGAEEECSSTSPANNSSSSPAGEAPAPSQRERRGEEDGKGEEITSKERVEGHITTYNDADALVDSMLMMEAETSDTTAPMSSSSSGEQQPAKAGRGEDSNSNSEGAQAFFDVATKSTVVNEEESRNVSHGFAETCDKDTSPKVHEASNKAASSSSSPQADEKAPLSDSISFDDEDALDLIFCDAVSADEVEAGHIAQTDLVGATLTGTSMNETIAEKEGASTSSSSSSLTTSSEKRDSSAAPLSARGPSSKTIMPSPLTLSNRMAARHPSALASLAASPKPGVIDHIGKWVASAAASVERSRRAAEERIKKLAEDEEGLVFLAAEGATDVTGNSQVGGGKTAEDMALRESASEENKLNVTEGWLATPEKAPARTNKLEFDEASLTSNAATHRGGGRSMKDGGVGVGSGGGYLTTVSPRVVKLRSDLINVSGSFVSHPHRRLSGQRKAGVSAIASFEDGGGQGGEEGFKNGLVSSQGADRPPFVFPEYYNSQTGRFRKHGGNVSDKVSRWGGSNKDFKNGIELTPSKIWRVGEREETKRQEALFAAAAAAAKGGRGKGDSSTESALAVLFGRGEGVGGRNGAAGLTSDSSISSAPSSVVNVPSGMSVSDFLKTFTNPNEVLAKEFSTHVATAKGMTTAAASAILRLQKMQSTTGNGVNNNVHPADNRSLSAFLLSSQAKRRSDGSFPSSSGGHMQSSSAQEQSRGIAPYKTHQRWFEVSLVSFPADLPSVAGGAYGALADEVWMAPRNSTPADGGAANTVKVAVASSISPRYTSARLEVSRKYLMGLVCDLEQLASNAL